MCIDLGSSDNNFVACLSVGISLNGMAIYVGSNPTIPIGSSTNHAFTAKLLQIT